MPAPRAVFLDGAGKPLSGGKLYTYEAGTTTNLATYSDSALTVANANPVILDSAGRAIVYLSARAYKFRLDTSADVTVWTQDLIDAVPSGSGLNTDILGTVNAAVVSGDCLILSDGSGSRTAGQFYKCDADDLDLSARPEVVGFATATIAAAASGLIRLDGALAGFSGLTAGSLYYMSSTAAGITSTVPTTTFPRIVGVALTTTRLAILPRPPIALDTITTQTASYTVLATDQLILQNSASATTITLYAASGNVGRLLKIRNINSGTVSITAAGSDLIDGVATVTAYQNEAVVLEVATASTWRTIARTAPLRGYPVTLADVTNTAAQTTTVSFPVPANDLANGDYIELTVTALVKNNKGTTGTMTFDLSYGATTATLFVSAAQSNNATERVVVARFVLQRAGTSLYASPGNASAVSPDTVLTIDVTGGNQNAILIGTPTFSSDQTVSLKVTLSAADATFYFKPQAGRAQKHAAQ